MTKSNAPRYSAEDFEAMTGGFSALGEAYPGLADLAGLWILKVRQAAETERALEAFRAWLENEQVETVGENEEGRKPEFVLSQVLAEFDKRFPKGTP